MNVIEITVSKQKMTARAPCTLVAGTVGHYGVKVTYDEEWNATPIRLIEFIGCADLKLQDTGGVIEIPHECIEKPCYLRFGLLGLDGNGDVRITTYSEANCIEVVPADFRGEAETDEPLPEPTPSEYERIITELEEVKQKSAYNALIYGDYSTMVTSLNNMAADSIGEGQNIFIVTLNVPDLWVSEIAIESASYEYVSDEQFVADLADGTVQVGHFLLSPLETQKVDLDGYVKKDDYATDTNAGVVKAKIDRGASVEVDGTLIVQQASKYDVDKKENLYKPITPYRLDYAVMKALTDSKTHTWTEEEKQLARELLGSVGNDDYPTYNKAGVVKVDAGNGVAASTNGELFISSASKSNIDGRTTSIIDKASYRKPIVPAVLDYAVKKALSSCILEGDDAWTDEEKASALALLGVDELIADLQAQIDALKG